MSLHPTAWCQNLVNRQKSKSEYKLPVPCYQQPLSVSGNGAQILLHNAEVMVLNKGLNDNIN